MSETNYDIFIAYKDKNDNSDRTWSSIIGEQIYTSLKTKGYSPFYSHETMEGMEGGRVSYLIDHALATARMMIVVFSSPEEFNSKWVKYEWREFMRVNKPVIIVFKDIKSEDWEKIQPEINDILGFDLTDDAGHHKYNRILEAVDKYMLKSSRSSGFHAAQPLKGSHTISSNSLYGTGERYTDFDGENHNYKKESVRCVNNGGTNTISYGGCAAAIVAAVMLIFIVKSCASSAFSDKDSKSDTNMVSVGSEIDDSLSIDSNDTSSTTTTTTQTTEPEIQTITIDSIKDTSCAINSIKTVKHSFDKAEIQTYSGTISEKKQVDEYTFEAEVSGVYRFEFSDVPDAVYFNLIILKSGGSKLKSSSSIGSGKGITTTLEEGQTYKIQVKQSKNTGSYNLNVGKPNTVLDITQYNQISDSMVYTAQENRYAYTTPRSGRYRFEFTGIPDATYLNLVIYNSGWEKIKSNYYDMHNGNGITADLEGNKTYYIKVLQKKNDGDYTLLIGCPKEIKDISKYTIVSDKIQYTDQINRYKMTASNDGTHRFEFADVPDATYFNLVIYNSGWEKIKSNYYDMHNGDGITAQLEKGKTYFVTVIQKKKTGKYSLKIGKPKKQTVVTDKAEVIDSIQFVGQQNVYEFTVPSSKKYNFNFTNKTNGSKIEAVIYNFGWEKIKGTGSITNSGNLSIDMEKGQQVYIVVKYYYNLSNYSFTVT